MLMDGPPSQPRRLLAAVASCWGPDQGGPLRHQLCHPVALPRAQEARLGELVLLSICFLEGTQQVPGE